METIHNPNILIVISLVFIVNVFFGYWRANVKKFSPQWFLSIHIPVPVVIFLRIIAGIGWRLITFPLLIGSFFFGQFIGGRLHHLFSKNLRAQISSCLVMDLVRIKKHT